MPKIRLLVIDDSATVRAIVEQVLEKDRDCEVVGVAASIAIARDLLRELKPNLITLDLNIPGVSGLEFLDELMLDRHAPVVVLSSSTCIKSEATREAIAHGAEACFDKKLILTETARFRRLLKKTLADHENRTVRRAAASRLSNSAAAKSL